MIDSKKFIFQITTTLFISQEHKNSYLISDMYGKNFFWKFYGMLEKSGSRFKFFKYQVYITETHERDLFV